MMWLTKLKLLTACGAAALTIGAATVGVGRHATAEEPKAAPAKPVAGVKVPPVRRDDLEIAEAEKFAGTWRIESETENDKPVKLDDLARSARYTFDGRGQCLVRDIAVEKRKPTERFEVCLYVVNPHRKLKELFFVSKASACIYEIDGDTLRTASYFAGRFDRPHGFAVADQPPGSPDLHVTVWKRESLLTK